MLSLPPLALALAAAVTLPSSAFFWNSGKESAQPDPEAPIARNMELTTYRDVALTGYLDAVDNQGDELTFQLTDTPARGSVELAEDGSARFVYTPYENKTGKDTFTYVAVDSQGNTSSPAEVTIHIEKPDTTVFYADLEGRPAHKAAIRLAEEDILVGRQVGDRVQVEDALPDGPLCFLEDGLPPLEQVEELILYCWNRDYPADVHLNWDLSAFTVADRRDFPGTSHKTITRTIYRRKERTP